MDRDARDLLGSLAVLELVEEVVGHVKGVNWWERGTTRYAAISSEPPIDEPWWWFPESTRSVKNKDMLPVTVVFG